MERLTFDHSEEWIERLLAIQDFPISEQLALLEHVTSCAMCGNILIEYYALSDQVRHLQAESVPLPEWQQPGGWRGLWQKEGSTSEQENKWRNFVSEVVSRYKPFS